MTTTTNTWLHLDGCTLDPQHRGACILDRPFRIRPEGGRENGRWAYGALQDSTDLSDSMMALSARLHFLTRSGGWSA